MRFRRLRGTAAWHWRQGCPSWPTTPGAEERGDLPHGAYRCTDCETLDLRSAYRRFIVEDHEADIRARLRVRVRA